MTRNIVEVRETAPLEAVMAEIGKQRSGIVGVVDTAGHLVGYVSAENLYELMTIRESRALRGM
jgi:CBS domain-containing protein